MAHGPSWEAHNSSASQKIPRILWNWDVHHRGHNSPPLFPILWQTNPVHVISSYVLWSTLISSSHLSLRVSRGLVPSGLPPPSYMHKINFQCLGRSKEAVQDSNPLTYLNMLTVYRQELSAPRPNPKVEDHPLSAVRDCLFNIFAATLHAYSCTSFW